MFLSIILYHRYNSAFPLSKPEIIDRKRKHRKVSKKTMTAFRSQNRKVQTETRIFSRELLQPKFTLSSVTGVLTLKRTFLEAALKKITCRFAASQKAQEIQHNQIKFSRFFHIWHVGGIGYDNLFCSFDIVSKQVSSPQDFRIIKRSNHD